MPRSVSVPLVASLLLLIGGCSESSPPEPVGPRTVVSCPSCALEEPSYTEWQSILTAISHIDTSNPECDAIHEAAMMESFMIFSFDDWNEAYADHHSSGSYGDQTHISDVNIANPQELSFSIIHELAHHNGAAEEMANYYMDMCYVQ